MPSRSVLLSKLLICFPQYTFSLPHSIETIFQMAPSMLWCMFSNMGILLCANLPQKWHQVCLPTSTAYSQNKQRASILVGKSWTLKRNEHKVFLSRSCFLKLFIDLSPSSLLQRSLKERHEAVSPSLGQGFGVDFLFFLWVFLFCFVLNKGCLSDVS